MSTSFARADHVHDTVLGRTSATDVNQTSTSSGTDVVLTSMTLTPAAGTYWVYFDSTVVNSGNGAERVLVSLYVNGVQRAHTLKRIGIAGGAQSNVTIGDIVSVNGSQAIDIRWRVPAGTGTCFERSLHVVRIGP
ncbi:MAG TPA: hypothetical protein V6C65_23570 [Allocoleopsis sp.]